METVLALVRDYGTAVYVLLFAYCALKSGSLPLFAGYAAQTGALDVATVAAATFAGGYLGDEARFAVARRYGHRLSTGRPRMARLIARGTDLLDRYGLIYLFLYRYPKGMRTIGALPVGLTTALADLHRAQRRIDLERASGRCRFCLRPNAGTGALGGSQQPRHASWTGLASARKQPGF
jgi:hypothetical protein